MKNNQTPRPRSTALIHAVFVVAAIIAMTNSCGEKATSTNLKALFEKDALVVDVRTPAEFALGHHPRAVNIPVDQLASRLAEFGDKAKPVVVYCASGIRSGQAKRELEAAGFSAVTNAGGINDLP